MRGRNEKKKKWKRKRKKERMMGWKFSKRRFLAGNFFFFFLLLIFLSPLLLSEMQAIEDQRGEKVALRLAVAKILKDQGGEAAEAGVLEDLADMAGSCNIPTGFQIQFDVISCAV